MDQPPYATAGDLFERLASTLRQAEANLKGIETELFSTLADAGHLPPAFQGFDRELQRVQDVISICAEAALRGQGSARYPVDDITARCQLLDVKNTILGDEAQGEHCPVELF
ncbi:hypothetical protein SAMN05421688_0572 [Poseidonocella pacifica]|uniref:Uncharacterized protein n=1 Tax=Poseidonocella pacifica TaxID=871651 RepID=A0A1I0VEX3_9RHOB|nr:hypothetical protein [Poseidonocella pacifica]SFA74842.1 hypothetical protein SAMN05421688_0572 [Poseidonocella pacifica]